MKKKYDIVSVGTIAYDMILRTLDDGVFTRDTTVLDSVGFSVGGNAMIQTLVAQTLGAQTAIVGKVADDAFGTFCLNTLDEVGVDRSRVIVSKEDSMSLTFALVKADGTRHFLGVPGSNNQSLCLKDMDLSVLEDARIVSYGSFFWLKALDEGENTRLFQIAKDAGALTVADCSDDSFGQGPDIVLRNLKYIDYFIPSLIEAQYVSGKTEPDDMAEVFFSHGCKNVLIKLGEAGCYVNDGQSKRIIPAYHMEDCCDTTGAGDTFVGGFMAGLSEGMDVFHAARYGCAAAAISVTGMGGFSALKDKRQVLDLIGDRD